MSQTPQFDATVVRGDFPIFSQPLKTGRHRKGHPPAFLDSAASAQKPHCVIDREREVQEHFYANAYRGVYEFGAQVDEELESVRHRVATLIGAASKEDIVFTSGTTMSLNLVASAWGRRFLNPGDTVLITQLEHHANIVPWQRICAERKATLQWLPLTGDRRLDMDRLDEMLTPRTRMVSVSAMSNVLGTVNPIDEIARRSHHVGALVCVDAAQSVPHMRIDVNAADGHGEPVDFLAFSGHKLYGPTGIGVLYARHDLLQEMDPFLGGGHMVSQVFQDRSTWADPPAKFEAGTVPIVQAIALGSAIDYVTGLGLDQIQQYECHLLQYAHQELETIPGLTIHGPDLEHKGAICSFTIDGVAAEDLAQLLDIRGVFVRHGHHCAMPLHEVLRVPATVRASFGVYNSVEDVDRLTSGIQFALERLGIA